MQKKHHEVHDSRVPEEVTYGGRCSLSFCERRCPKATVRSRQEIGEIRLGGSISFLTRVGRVVRSEIEYGIKYIGVGPPPPILQ